LLSNLIYDIISLHSAPASTQNKVRQIIGTQYQCWSWRNCKITFT